MARVEKKTRIQVVHKNVSQLSQTSYYERALIMLAFAQIFIKIGKKKSRNIFTKYKSDLKLLELSTKIFWKFQNIL